MKNTLADLNNYLFAQIERLDDDELTPEQLSIEITRSKAIAEISREVVSNAGLVLKAYVKVADGELRAVPKMLEGGN